MKVILSFLIAFSAPVFASNYACSDTMSNDYSEQGAIKVRRGREMCGGSRLVIDYYGELKNVSVYIRIKYQDGVRSGLFPMRSLGLSGWTAEISSGCLVGKLGGCEMSAPQEMKDLLFWASRPDGWLNALDFEVAFVDAKGNWDSRGANYPFHFAQP